MYARRTLVLALGLLAGAACSGGSDASTGPGASNVASVELTPLTPTIGVDSALSFAAVSKDASGNAISSATVTWSSSDPTKATIDASGVAHGVSAGVVAITATSGTRSASTVLAVRTGTVVRRPPARVLSAGLDHACAVVSASLSCWGSDFYSEVGIAATSTCTSSVGAASTPCVPAPEHPTGGLTFVTTAAGGSHTCGITSAGKAYCWGDNSHGQLGNGIAGTATSPSAVSGGLTFVSIAAGYQFSCGLTSDGNVYCWGRNDAGEVGAGLQASIVSTPQLAIASTTFVAIATGWEHACAIAIDGTLYCWGRGDGGRLALSGTGSRSVPALVPGNLRWKQITGGEAHTCGITTTGAAYCWGAGSSGQIGDGGNVERDTPTLVSSGTTFTDISAGFFQTCAIRSDAHAFCWGSNHSGELGDNGASGPSSASPVAVAGALTWSQISAGAGLGIAFSCGVTTAGQTYCWGDGAVGQLGDNLKSKHMVPTQISAGGS